MKMLLAALLLVSVPRLSHAAAAAPVLEAGNEKASASAAQNLSFIGCKVARVELSTTPVLVAAGSGMLYSLRVSSGLAGAGAVAFDSASISGLGLNGAANIPSAKAISPLVLTNPTTSGSNAVNAGALDFGANPMRFENGLVITNTTAATYAVGCYRKDDGVNP